MDTTTVDYKTALSPERIKSVGKTLDELPRHGDYSQYITEKFQQTLFKSEHLSRTFVDFAEIPQETQNLLGFVDGDSTPPWWLRDFEWTFHLSDGETIDPSELERLDESDPEDTQLNLPILNEDTSDTYTILKNLHEVNDYIKNNVDLAGAELLDNYTSIEFPDQPFKITTTLITKELGEFF